jgi:hypothetical protein
VRRRFESCRGRHPTRFPKRILQGSTAPPSGRDRPEESLSDRCPGEEPGKGGGGAPTSERGQHPNAARELPEHPLVRCLLGRAARLGTRALPDHVLGFRRRRSSCSSRAVRQCRVNAHRCRSRPARRSESCPPQRDVRRAEALGVETWSPPSSRARSQCTYRGPISTFAATLALSRRGIRSSLGAGQPVTATCSRPQ